MKPLKKITALFLALTLSFCLSSCFIVINDPDETKPAAPEETSSPFLPIETVEHRDVVGETLDPAVAEVRKTLSSISSGEHEALPITVTCVTGAKLFAPGEDNGTFSRAVDTRNKLLKEYAGTDIIVQERTYEEMLSEARTAKNAGQYYTDVVCIPLNELGSLLGQRMLMNLKTLYDTDFDKDWFDVYSTDQLAAGSFSYGILGDAILPYDSVYCVYFNKDMTALYPDLYDIVDRGEWTFDKMYEYIREVVSREEGVCGLGYGTDNTVFSNICFNATGLGYVTTSFGNTPVLNDDSDTVDEFVGLIKKLLVTEDSTHIQGTAEEARQAFLDGKLLFYIDKLSESEDLTNNFGILPVPKYFTDGDYTTYVDEFAPVIVVLNSNNTLERTGEFLQFVNASTGKLLRDGYVRDAVDNVVRDIRSADMIEIILDNTRYEFPTVFGVRYPAVANATYNAVSQAIFGNADYSTIRSRAAANFNAEMRRSFS